MGCKPLTNNFFYPLEIIHSKKKATEQKKRINYYPFGGSHKGYNNVINGVHHPYGYNGKEENDELGLQWLDYGARNYDKWLGRWMNVDPAADVLESSSPYVYALNSPIVYLDQDGELPILINGRVGKDSERADESYWTTEIVATIQGSGIANPGGQIHYVDGDRWFNKDANFSGGAILDGKFDNGALWAGNREKAGYKSLNESEFKNILSKLERDESGKIIEKIQIYTHSRGAAFGIGYTKRLLEMISKYADQFADPSNVVDFVLNMAQHQSGSLDYTGIDNVYSIDHDRDKLSDNDAKGTNGQFTTKEKSKGFFGAHSITSFKNNITAFAKSFASGKATQSVIDDFVKKMKDDYGITVTVKQ